MTLIDTKKTEEVIVKVFKLFEQEGLSMYENKFVLKEILETVQLYLRNTQEREKADEIKKESKEVSYFG